MSDRNVRIDGDNNLLAGNDIVFNNFRILSHEVHRRFREFDEIINAMIPEGVVDPKNIGKNAYFSSSRAVTSLMKIDMPIGVALKVVENIPPIINKISKEEEEISTFHLRKAVVAAINDVDFPNLTSDGCKDWCSRYIRRYGDPDHRVKIIMYGGKEEYLSYKFLNENLIPDLLDRVFDKKFGDLGEKILSNNMIYSMSDHIISQINSMELFAIHYQTLLNIAYDMSIQPPYPWLVEEAYLSDIVLFHIERSDINMKLLKDSGDKENYARLHFAHEVVHHSCAAILGYYGQIIGCKYLSPVNTLINVLKLNDEQPHNALWSFWKAGQIPGDLKAIGWSVGGVQSLLKKIAEALHPQREKDYKLIFEFSRELNELTNTLISESFQSKELATKDWNEKEDAYNGCLAIFSRIPQIRIDDENLDECLIWIRHRFATQEFREIKPKILIAISDGAERSREIFEMAIDLKSSANKRRFWNTVIVVCKNNKAIINCASNQELTFINVDYSKFRLLENDNDRPETFSEVIWSSLS